MRTRDCVALTTASAFCYNIIMITIIGIGNKKGDLTQNAAEKIAKSKHVFLRSAKTAAGNAIMKEYPHVQSLDDCYDSAASFDELSAKICDILIKTDGECGDAVYLTDGSGSDGIACELYKRVRTEMIFGVAQNNSRGFDTGALDISATAALGKKPYLDTLLPVHVYEIDDAFTAGDIKLWLMDYYDDEQEITVYSGGKSKKIPLCELDKIGGYDYSCELYIEGKDSLYKSVYSFGDLMRIMGRLTAADGCPWDKAQTHESIRINMIEEAYEAVDAIDGGDISAMIEELGDVMLQSVFHCDMAKRFGEFTLSDVISELCNKLVGRHTHIFGENKASDADEALGYWEQAKAKEKSYVSTADKLNRLPECFPSLLAAEKVYKKLIKAGVKADKETLLDMANSGDYAKKLFALTALAAECGLDAEVELNKYIANLKKNFAQAEKNNDTSDFLNKL